MWSFYLALYIAVGFAFLVVDFDFEELLEGMVINKYYEPQPALVILLCYVIAIMLCLLVWPWFYIESLLRR